MLEEENLKNIFGGVNKLLIVGVAGLIVSFVIGVFDGYFRPLKCNEE